ncbi:MAG: hypothetical protein ACC683_10380, partial [Acidimicrobiia bacterium]
MPTDIDELFSHIRAISESLDALSEGDPTRVDLIAQRDRLRVEARRLGNATRHPRSVEAQISMLENRLDEIRDKFVGKGYAEKYLTKGFSDPGAYSATINRKIEEEHAD